MSSRLWVRSVASVVSITGLVLVAGNGCGGTAVFDAPDPKACGAGHGCPMAGCVCGDDSVILDTTCELGKCGDVAKLCDDRCAGFDGVKKTFQSEDDEVPLPNCETFCTRLLVNGCELGCSTLFTECLVPTSCSQAAAAYWQCATEHGVISCIDNAVRIEKCDSSAVEMCEK
jgi:hypothetical protein